MLHGSILKQGTGIQGIAAAASQGLHEQTAPSRAGHLSSLGVDRTAQERLSGAGQDRTAWSGRPAGTQHSLFSSWIPVLCALQGAIP